MNTIKQIYIVPQIKCIELDNQISLQLVSDAPAGPDETHLNAPEYFNNCPFKSSTT